MDTKLKGDLAEQSVVLRALKMSWGVLRPVGDRLPYDLVFDVRGILVKVQVKCAWIDKKSGNYVVDVRRTKTNRRRMRRERYQDGDFDFAIAYLPEADVFYVLPLEAFARYGSVIHFVEHDKRQRKPSSAIFRDAWELIAQWAARDVSRSV
jgi:hypothetical protein